MSLKSGLLHSNFVNGQGNCSIDGRSEGLPEREKNPCAWWKGGLEAARKFFHRRHRRPPPPLRAEGSKSQKRLSLLKSGNMLWK